MLSALLAYADKCRGVLHYGKTSHIAVLHVRDINGNGGIGKAITLMIPKDALCECVAGTVEIVRNRSRMQAQVSRPAGQRPLALIA